MLLPCTHLRGKDQTPQGGASSPHQWGHHATFDLLKSPVLDRQAVQLGCPPQGAVKVLFLAIFLAFDGLPVNCHQSPEYRISWQLHETPTRWAQGEQRSWGEFAHDAKPHLQLFSLEYFTKVWRHCQRHNGLKGCVLLLTGVFQHSQESKIKFRLG